MLAEVRWLLLLLVLACTNASPGADDIVLRTPNGAITPDCDWYGEIPELRHGSQWLSVRGPHVFARDQRGILQWQVKDPSGRDLVAIIIWQDTLLLHRQPVMDNSTGRWDFSGCGEVLRIGLLTGSWLPPLPLDTDAKESLLVADAISAGDRLLVSRSLWITPPKDEQFCSALEVTSLQGTKAIWCRRWPCGKSIPQPDAFLLTGIQPVSAEGGPRPCTPCGDMVLICPGSTSALFAVALANGTDRWTLDRVWEYDRNFIGPSVWSHEIRRFGTETKWLAFQRAGTKTVNVTQEDKAKVDAEEVKVIAELHQDFDQHHMAWINGGPWVMEHAVRDVQEPAILLSVAIAPQHPFARNLARERIFQINQRGEPENLADLPRVMSSPPCIHDGALCFAAAPGGVGAFRVFPSAGHLSAEFELRRDCLLPLIWYHETADERADSWLQGTWRPAQAIGAGIALEPLDDGTVSDPTARLLVHHLRCTDLSTGTGAQWILEVQLPSPVAVPATNFEEFQRRDGSKAYAVALPDQVHSLTSLQILDDRLVITLGQPNEHTKEIHVLVFALPKKP